MRIGIPVSLTKRNSPNLKYSNNTKNVKTTAFRSLERRFALVRYAPIKL